MEQHESHTEPNAVEMPAVKIHKINWRRVILVALDIACFIAAYLAVLILIAMADGVPHEQGLKTLSETGPGTLLLMVVVMLTRYILGVYRNVWRYPNVRSYLILVASDVFGGILGLLIIYVLASVGILPYFMGFWRVFCLITLFDLGTLVMRFIYQMYHQHCNIAEKAAADQLHGARHKIGVAILGAGQAGIRLAEELNSNPAAHYRPVCFVDCDTNKIGMRVADLKVYAEDDHILDILKDLPVQEVFVAIPELTAQDSQRLIQFYSDAGYKVKRYDFPTWDMLNAAGATDGGRPMVREFRIEDLLGRESLEKRINTEELRAYYRDRVVLVTGGGGSIGSEVCRQIATCRPARLIILDIYENNAYDIQQELTRKYGDQLDLRVEIASVRDAVRMDCIFKTYRPEVVFHATAHKHVPLMEHSSCEAIKNNVMGTYHAANMAEKYGAERFVLISTDKAVNPTNVMGASKRMCEMLVQCRRDSKTTFTAVRFGNVLGSNGSVIPLFRSQIELGGPVTITDKRIIRYFMTIPEASRLVMLAGSMAEAGQLFVLDMGKQIRILDMAENMIRMMGYTPYKDIDIVEVGLRPGEKLYEELLIKTENLQKTKNDLIFVETDTPLTRAEVDEKLDILVAAVKDSEEALSSPCIKAALKRVVPTFYDPDEINSHAEETREVKEANEDLVVS